MCSVRAISCTVFSSVVFCVPGAPITTQNALAAKTAAPGIMRLRKSAAMLMHDSAAASPAADNAEPGRSASASHETGCASNAAESSVSIAIFV